jgi:hypothetical protein
VEQDELLRIVVEKLDSLAIPYAITGSMACVVYGEPRQTHDIDIVIRLGFERVRALCSAFPEPEFYVSLEAAQDAVRHCSQFNVIHESGLKVDFIVAGRSPFDRLRLQNARRIRIGPDPGGQPSFASPEDVILKKMLFYREGQSDKHMRDIAGILKVMGDNLDRNYITQWANDLDVADIWQAIVKKVDGA